MPTYIHHEILDDVADVLDAQSVWHAPGLSLFPKKPQLKELLQRVPRQQKGRSMTRCFSHICLLLPQHLLEEDALLYRGSHQRELVEHITRLHETDFAPYLFDDAGHKAAVRYQILPDASLSERQIGVRFGHAFYLPDDSEQPQYRLRFSFDSVIWQEAGDEVGLIYPQQRLALLGDYPYEHADQIPGWPAALGASLLLINDGPGSKLQLQAHPMHAFDIEQNAASGHYVLSAKGNRAGVELGQTRRMLLKVETVLPKKVQPENLLQKNLPQTETRQDLPTANRPPAIISKETSKESGKDATRIDASKLRVWQARPQVTPTPACRADDNQPTSKAITANQANSLQAITPTPQVSPNAPFSPIASIPSTPAKAQASRSITQPPNATVPQPATAKSTTTATTVASSAPARTAPAIETQDSDLTYIPLRGRAPGSISLVALALPRLSRYPDAGVTQMEIVFGADMRVQLHPTSNRLLTLRVNAKDEIDISSKTGQQNITAPARFEPIAGRNLNLLSVSGSMQDLYCACLQLPHQAKAPLPPKTRQAFGRGNPNFTQLRILEQAKSKQLDRIGLSRKAFSIECENSGFHIWREAEHQALFHLDQDFQLVSAITSTPYPMPSGHHLVAGNYVLRLDL